MISTPNSVPSFHSNSEEWLEKMLHVALFLPVGPESYMFIHKTPCDDVVAEFGGIWDAIQDTLKATSQFTKVNSHENSPNSRNLYFLPPFQIGLIFVMFFKCIEFLSRSKGDGFSDYPLFREDILDDLACRKFRVSK